MAMSKSEIFLLSGSMFGKKSKKLIDIINVAINEKCKYIVLKPKSDTRDGACVRSRDYDEAIPATWFDKNTFLNQIKQFGLTIRPKIVFIDEVHFLSLDDIKYIHNICKAKGLTLVTSGLETDFRQDLFESTKYLKDYVTYYTFNHGKCNGCGEENAIYNVLYRDGKITKDGDSIQPGDKEYKVYCEECFSKL
jgi:thymidine kinase